MEQKTMKQIRQRIYIETSKHKPEQMVCRISKKLTSYANAETVLPLGSFSMAPMLRAE